jgi:hypothetical protein
LNDQLADSGPDAEGLSWDAEIPVVTTTTAWLFSSYYLSLSEQPFAIPVLAILVNSYTRFKGSLGALKPVIVGCLWAYAIVCMPTNEDVPLSLYPYATCLYAAASNLADIKDEECDRDNNVRTFAVQFGATASYIFSGVLAACALAIHHYVPGWTWGDIYNDVAVCGIMASCSSQLVANTTST